MHGLNVDEGIFKQILNAAGSAIVITDPRGTIKYTNPRFSDITGYQAAEVLGRTPRILNSGKMPKNFYQDLWRTIQKGSNWRGRVLNKRKNGQFYWSMQSISPITTVEGDIQWFVSVSEDVTEIETLKEQYKTLAFIDELTGLGNRRMFRKDLDMRIELATRSDDIYVLAIVNIVDFKGINEHHGHHQGNRVLRETAQHLKQRLKGQGDVYRLEGDEFVLLAGPYYDSQELEHLVNTLATLSIESAQQQPVHYSTGAALLPTDSRDASELMRFANLAERRAHTLPGSNVILYRDELTATSEADARLLGELVQAIDEKKLFVVGQAIFDLNTGKQVGTEILLRWHHPRLGAISPLKIIQLAEKYGYLHKLSVLIIDQVIKHIENGDQGLGHERIAINFNVAQVLDNSLIEHLCEALERAQIPRQRIMLELTENDRFNFKDPATRHSIELLRSCGFGIAIDDFGAGYATFEFINEINPDQIKIDRGLINNIEHQSKKLLTLTAILALTERLEVETVVEGIERPEQHQILQLQNTGPLCVQGYFYARPTGLPAAFSCDNHGFSPEAALDTA